MPESRSLQALTLDSIGFAQHRLDRHDEAIETYHRALRLFEETGDQYFHATTLNRLGDLHHEVGDDTAARDCWQRALTVLTALGHADAIAVHEKL